MKTFKQSILLLGGLFLLTIISCKKTDITPASSTSAKSTSNLSASDKLVVSKVTGSIESDFPLFSPFLLNLYYTYTWNNDVYELGPNKGNFQKTFTYGNDKNSGYYKKFIQQEAFLNTGHYDFLYKATFPDKVIDNSVPGYDLGYWRTYIDKAQIQKVGLAFSSDADPAYFEFYTRNYKGEITGYIFGKTVDAPVYKIVYTYDNAGNISEFQLFQPVTLTVANMQDMMIEEQQKRYGLPLAKSNYGLHKKLENLQKIIADNKHYSSSVISENSIEYRLYLTAKVTTDDRINPYNQQNQILFYQTSRNAFAYDPAPYFLSLLKSNPVKIEYAIPGAGLASVQTFSYIYNN